jgi:hypothetical protein
LSPFGNVATSPGTPLRVVVTIGEMVDVSTDEGTFGAVLFYPPTDRPQRSPNHNQTAAPRVSVHRAEELGRTANLHLSHLFLHIRTGKYHKRPGGLNFRQFLAVSIPTTPYHAKPGHPSQEKKGKEGETAP